MTRWVRGLVSVSLTAGIRSNVLKHHWVIHQLCVLSGADAALWSLLWRQKNLKFPCCESVKLCQNKSWFLSCLWTGNNPDGAFWGASLLTGRVWLGQNGRLANFVAFLRVSNTCREMLIIYTPQEVWRVCFCVCFRLPTLPTCCLCRWPGWGQEGWCGWIKSICRRITGGSALMTLFTASTPLRVSLNTVHPFPSAL